jgi:anti-sigma factor RsiW
MNEEPILTEADRIQEELVAYLDGELDAAESDRIERRLADDPAYRQKLTELQAAWDLLDQLPRAPVTETFTQTTVEMVAVTAEAEALQAEKSLDRRRIGGWIALAACTLVAGLAGYVVMAQRLDSPNQRLVEDLPIIEHVELYRVAESVDFLRELEQADLFSEEQSADE